MSLQNTVKNAAYDNPAYLARGAFSSVTAAGSGGVSGKFVAHANLLLFGLTAYTTTAGTSTYTATQYYGSQQGTSTYATVHANTTQLSLVRITNTATFGAAPALSTSTIATLYADNFYTNGTATCGVGSYSQLALNTSTGTAGLGGVAINFGDQIYVLNGTDTSAVNLVTIDYAIAPLANVVA